MAFYFKFPDVGEGIHEGEIVKWKIKEGDIVKEDQVIAEVETAKAIVEMHCPRDGTLLKLNHKEGDTIKVGDIFAVIGQPGEKIEDMSAAEPKKQAYRDALKPATAPAVQQTFGIMAAPSTRKLARELNVDISRVNGTGSGGRITDHDVRNAVSGAAQQQKPSAPVPSMAKEDMPSINFEKFGKTERKPIKGVRKSVYEAMTRSHRIIPQVTNFDEADVTELVKLREKEKKKLEKDGIKLTFLPFIVKAVEIALKEFPEFNASLDDNKNEIVYKKYYNIGIAVDTEDGLIVPNVKDADKKSMVQLAKEMNELAEKARARKLSLEDLQGTTFTITNLGTLGTTYATPLVNHPEVAILATNRLKESPIIINGKLKTVFILPLSLSFDHRLIDGALACRFLNEVIKHLEDPNMMLIEMM